MKRAVYIQKDLDQIGTITDMTSIFEAIASIHISQIKDRVMASTKFFNELWHIYAQLRVGEKDFVQHRKPKITKRGALVLVTSDGGLIGDIDERIVTAALAHPKRELHDIFVIGAHGGVLLGRHGVKPTKVFALPEKDDEINVTPVAQLVNQYGQATVYYQTYVSLLKQEIARINLFNAVSTLGKTTTGTKEVISSRDYIFEPSLNEIITFMESVMVEIALGQIVLESKLAQYASRFNTMSAAKAKAKEMQGDLRISYNRAKRGQADDRIKEVISAMKILEQTHG